MTYCGGILVREGLVMFADTRTNAGVDNISTFRKLHVFKDPKKRVMAIASAGNLSISQSVVSTLTEGYDNPESGERETLMNAPTLFQAACVLFTKRKLRRSNHPMLVSMSPSCSEGRSWASACVCS
jgi:putative proteasome-type protease